VPVSVHLLILLAGEDSGPAQPDNFWIWPNDNHNVTAIEAYGTLALAIISVVIAGLVWQSVQATRQSVEATRENVRATNDDVQATLKEVATNREAIQTSAIQTIAGEILTLGRWLADHPEYGQALRLPADQETQTGDAVATVHTDFMDAVFSQQKLFPPGDVDIWITWFQNRMAEWPQLDKFVRTHLHWYPEYMKGVFPEGDDGSLETMFAKRSPAQVDKPTSAVHPQ
jgi:hypothetical protein